MSSLASFLNFPCFVLLMLLLAQSPDSILLICNQFGTNTQFDLHTFFKPDISPSYHQIRLELDLAFNNVKPKDWYFVLD